MNNDADFYRLFDAYGKVFYRHYDLKQAIKDHFDGKTPDDEYEINQLLAALHKELVRVNKFFKENKPITNAPGKVFETLERYDLTTFDIKNDNENPQSYSELFCCMISCDPTKFRFGWRDLEGSDYR